ncbi:MAG: LysE family translocator [Sedimenticola sp.]
MQEIFIYIPGILLAYLAFILAIASPGPNILAVIGTSMGISREAGISLAFGIAVGSLTWATLSVIGLTVIFSEFSLALYVVKILGGAYLLWLAYKSFKSAFTNHEIETKKILTGKYSKFSYAKSGFIIMMTNPKAPLAWVAIISLGLKEGSPLWVSLALVAGTFLISVTAHILYAVVFSTPIMILVYSKARRYIQATLGGFFAFAGIKLLSSKA